MLSTDNKFNKTLHPLQRVNIDLNIAAPYNVCIVYVDILIDFSSWLYFAKIIK